MSRGARWTQDQLDAAIAAGCRIHGADAQNATYTPTPAFGNVSVAANASYGAQAAKNASTGKRGMNATEREFLAILGARLLAGTLSELWPHESVKFRVGANRCWYTPDFAGLDADGRLVVWECKARRGKWTSMRDDARVKLQSAARQYPGVRWHLCERDQDGTWSEVEI